MTAKYEQMGIRFLYPENWELDNRGESNRPWSVSVHSPGGAFWSISVLEPSDDLEEMGDATLKAVEEEFQESFFESERASEQIGGQVATGHDIHFYYLDFLIAAKLRMFRIGTHGCVMLCQAEDRDFDQLEQVFRAITESLFRPDIMLN